MTRTLTIPLRPYSGGISIQLPEDTISEADWAVLIAVLDAMKPALVAPDPVDAEIANPLQLTPDEAIEVALIIREQVDRTGTREQRGTNLPDLADRLDAHERET